jgi:hypothetical protein
MFQLCIILSTLIVLTAICTSYIIPVLADDLNPGVYTVNSSPFDIPYQEWITKWWQWHISIPKESHPAIDYSPEKCSVNQDGPVWFLADKIESGVEKRDCVIPLGKAILFPVLSGECDYGISTVKSDADLIPCASEGNDFSVVSTTVDGVKLKELEKYRIYSDFFNITIPEDNAYDAGQGTFRAFVDGYFVFLEPLSPGIHEIRFTDSVSNPLEPSYDNAKDITYNITVTS